MKTAKWMNLMVLSLVVILQGCAFQSPIMDIEEPRAGFVITRPPVQIAYRGDVSPEAEAFTLRILRQMQTEKSTTYKFNENTNVRLNSIDGKADNINVNLHEHSQSSESTEDFKE